MSQNQTQNESDHCGLYLPEDNTQDTRFDSERRYHFGSDVPTPPSPLSAVSHLPTDLWQHDSPSSLKAFNRMTRSPTRSSSPLSRPDSRSSFRSPYTHSSVSYPSSRQSSYLSSSPVANLELQVTSLTTQVTALNAELAMLKYVLSYFTIQYGTHMFSSDMHSTVSLVAYSPKTRQTSQ